MTLVANEAQVPHSEEAEAAVLGSLLVDPDCWSGLTLQPADFFGNRNHKVYAAMLDLHKKGMATDSVTLAQELNRRGELEEVGASYLSKMVSELPTSLNCPYYAKVVKEQAGRRSLIALASNAAQAAYSGPDLDAACNEIIDGIAAIKRRHTTLQVVGPKERAEMMFEHFLKLKDSPDAVYTPTGIPLLDQELGGGMFPGEFVAIGAGSGKGKSTVALDIANHVAATGHVVYVSTEMDVPGLTYRDVARITGMPIEKVRKGQYNGVQWDAIQNALEEINNRNIHFHHNWDGITPAAIEQAVEQTAMRNGLVKLVIVDYIGEIEPDRTAEKRYMEIGSIGKRLKGIANKYQCPVVGLMQFRKDRPDDTSRPQVSWFYESGRIEQQADVILLLWRLSAYYTPEQYNAAYHNHEEWHNYYQDGVYPAEIDEYGNTIWATTEINIAKQRQSSKGTVYRICQVPYTTKYGFMPVPKDGGAQ